MAITMREMLEAGIHFGHRTRFWNPKMAPYIYGSRDNIHIINLDHTYQLFTNALQFIANIISNRGKILFVGTKYAAQGIIQTQATRCGMPFVNHRWLGGMLTNYKTIRQSVKRLKELEDMRVNNGFEGLTKKETLNLLRELTKLELSLGGIKNMGGLPDAVFIVDTGQEKIAVAEAKRLRIPVIGVVDSNNDPSGIDYLIPGNDDSIRAIDFYAKHIADTVLETRSYFTEDIDAKKAGADADKDTEEKATKKIVQKRTGKKKPAADSATVESPLMEIEDKLAEEEPMRIPKKDTAKQAAAKKPQSTNAKQASPISKTNATAEEPKAVKSADNSEE